MNKKFLLPILLGALVTSCTSSNSDQQVVSRRYIHKYGYAVSKEDFSKHRYPGQIITTLRDGVTITATYENGLLHGPCTHTHPHSETVQYFYLYHEGALTKELIYNALGMPLEERIQLSPQRYSLTKWYNDGTPMSIENYAGEELIDGEYLSQRNEVESRVEMGSGERIYRNPEGVLLIKDQVVGGYISKRETFYPSGMPQSIAAYSKGKLQGEKTIFAETGEPKAIEEWHLGLLQGKNTLFAGGVKQSEIYYLSGQKNGPEIHYVDGEKVDQEILWSHDKRHGPTKFFIGGVVSAVEWYYDGRLVNKRKYEELSQLDYMITQSFEKGLGG
jgi:antitoxin component YwqK of YwqJK toxin-antitoxin module